MRLLLLVIMLGLILVSPASPVDNDAGRESPFSMGVGARALGMGGGFTALVSDAGAVFYNPARLPLLSDQEVTFMHATLFEGTKYDFGAWALPIDNRYGAAVGFMRIGTDGIITRENFAPLDTISFSQSQLMFAYGSRVLPGIYFGGSFKVVSQSLGMLSDYAFGADLALSSEITRHLHLGLIARDLFSPELKIDTLAEKTPRSLVAALALKHFPLTDYIDLSIALDFERTQGRQMKYLAGAEFLFAEHYALRAGYNRDNITLGAGLSLNRVQFDYAFKLMEFIDDSHRFSISFMIGKGKQAEVSPGVPEIRPELLPTLAELKATESKEKAVDFFVNSKLDSALYYYNLSLRYDSTDEETRRMIIAVEAARQAKEARSTVDTIVQREQFTDQYYHQAYEFFTKKYYPAAKDLLKLILEIDPGYSRAVALEGTIQEAIKTELATLSSEAEVARGEGRVIDEIEAYNKILDLQPDQAEALAAKLRALAGLGMDQQLSLGVRLFSQGRYNSARRRFEAALKINAEDPVALEYLERIRQVASAPSSTEELQGDPAAWTLYLEGIKFMRSGEYARAIAAWEKVLLTFPNNSNTLNNLEQARLRLNSEEGK